MSPAQNIEFVLLNPSHPGNIGAVARALKNMGLSRLALVKPESFPHPDAERRASGATDILDSARQVESLDAAIADAQVVVGTSARPRTLPWPVCTPRELAQQILSQPGRQFAIVFGPEARGLSNEELQRCDVHLSIPANPEYSALNLAMAVQIIAYEIRCAAALDSDGPKVPQDAGWDELPASKADIERMLAHLEQALIAVDFHDPDNPRQLMARLRRLFQRKGMDQMEINILRGFCKAVIQRSS